MGVAMTIAIAVTISVPRSRVVTSKMPRRGNQPIPVSCVRSIWARKLSASTRTVRTMKTEITIVVRAAARNSTRTVRSRRWRFALPRSEMLPPGRAGVACAMGPQDSSVWADGR